jgi:hypothetical protein
MIEMKFVEPRGIPCILQNTIRDPMPYNLYLIWSDYSSLWNVLTGQNLSYMYLCPLKTYNEATAVQPN